MGARADGAYRAAATMLVHLYRDAWAEDPKKQAELTLSVMKNQIGPSGRQCTRYLDVTTRRLRRTWDEPAAKKPWWV